jgi:hypothetical protein
MSGAKVQRLTDLLELFPHNKAIVDAVIKTRDHINSEARGGGQDSGKHIRRQ